MSKLYLTDNAKVLRKKAEMTQQEFCEFLCVWLDKPIALSTLQKYEQGQKPVNPDVALEISRYFKVPVNEIVERR